MNRYTTALLIALAHAWAANADDWRAAPSTIPGTEPAPTQQHQRTPGRPYTYPPSEQRPAEARQLANGLWIVSAPWCEACQEAKRIAGDVPLRNLDWDHNRELAGRLGVTRLPTFLAIRNGYVIDRATGVTDRKRLAEMHEAATGPTREAHTPPPGESDTTTKLRAIQEQTPQRAPEPSAAEPVQWQPHHTAGDWRKCYEACVRIQQGNTFGSGGVFHVDAQNVWILTNAHVVGSARTVGVEFFRRGYKSQQIAGAVHYRKYVPGGDIDMAIVVVPRQLFGANPPAYLPIGRDPQPGQQVITTGCPRADWPALWSGHVVEVRGNIIHFTPGPKWLPDGGNMMSGRSGSVLVNADATEIVGLIAWSSRTHGMAQRISHVVRSATADETQLCGPFCRPSPQQPQPPQQPYGGGGGGGPWPSLPPEGAPQDPAEMADLRARVADLERDRAKFAAEWARMRGLVEAVRSDLPEIRQWVEETNSQHAREITSYVDRLLNASERKIETLQHQVDEAHGIKGWAASQLDEIRAELRGYLRDLASAKTALEVLQQYRDHRADHAPIDALKLALREHLDAVRNDLRAYAIDKANDAKESALETAGSLAVRFLPWPIATALSVASAAWAWGRRRRANNED